MRLRYVGLIKVIGLTSHLLNFLTVKKRNPAKKINVFAEYHCKNAHLE
jgi:hypothetical protein